MRGGLFQDPFPGPPPFGLNPGEKDRYTDDDLEREFGATHDLGHLSDVIQGRLWTACPLADPFAVHTTAASPVELAEKLRARP
jgi:hypothetical protein